MIHDGRDVFGLTTRNDVLGTHAEFLRQFMHLQRDWFLRQTILLITSRSHRDHRGGNRCLDLIHTTTHQPLTVHAACTRSAED